MSAAEPHRAQYAGRQIEFVLLRARRRTLGITVTADGKIIVRAPEAAPLEEIVARVSRRGAWITKALTTVERQPLPTPPRLFEPGETHLYLGRQYRLSVRRSLREEVLIEGDRLVLAMHRPGDRDGRRALLDAWYLDRAKVIYAERLDRLFESFERLGHAKPRIQVMDLEKRWGSLTRSGVMVLSRGLVRAPRSCIDYVIVHELCHLEHQNHGWAFQQLLTRMMPDAEARKALLERILA